MIKSTLNEGITMLKNMEDKKFMTLVFDLVKKAMLENHGGPFGSIIVKNS